MIHRSGLTSAIAGLGILLSSSFANGQGLEDTLPGPLPEGKTRIALEIVASGLTAPNYGTHAPGLPNYLFVTDQDGILWAIDLVTESKTAFLDVSGLIVQLGARLLGVPAAGLPPLPFDERGLIGIAFHPQYQSNGKFYTFTSEPLDGPGDFGGFPAISPELEQQFADLGLTFPNHQSVISEWQAVSPSDPSSGVGPGRRVLMRIDQPQFNHNSGSINFGPDGMLYATIGDGGGADDQPEADMQDFLGVPILGHGLTGNGQNPGVILGSVIRIDPDGDNAPNGQYGIPDDNPFVPANGSVGGQAGCEDGWCDEIYAYGFRNAFRSSFDMKTGQMFLGDVGQNNVEEVNIVVAGGNYGWKLKEGTFLFDHNGDDGANGAAFASKNSPNVPPGMIDPIAQYDHDEGVAIIGGFVYRGREVGALRGRYIFGEFAEPPFSPFAPDCNGRLFSLGKKIGGKDLTRRVVGNRIDGKLREFPGDVSAGFCLLGFGQDAYGEVYVLANVTGLPAGEDGVVMKIVRDRRQHSHRSHRHSRREHRDDD